MVYYLRAPAAETATSSHPKAFKHGNSSAVDLPDDLGIRPGDEVVIDRDDPGAIVIRKAPPKESLAHFSMAATKLTAAQRKATDAWAAQLERDREAARKAGAKADRELALQKAQLEKVPSKKPPAQAPERKKAKHR